MKISLTVRQQDLRDEIRSFLADELPVELARRVKLGRPIDKEDQRGNGPPPPRLPMAHAPLP